MIIHYIVEKEIFVVIVYKLLEEEMYWNAPIRQSMSLQHLNKVSYRSRRRGPCWDVITTSQ